MNKKISALSIFLMTLLSQISPAASAKGLPVGDESKKGEKNIAVSATAFNFQESYKKHLDYAQMLIVDAVKNRFKKFNLETFLILEVHKHISSYIATVLEFREIYKESGGKAMIPHEIHPLYQAYLAAFPSKQFLADESWYIAFSTFAEMPAAEYNSSFIKSAVANILSLTNFTEKPAFEHFIFSKDADVTNYTPTLIRSFYKYSGLGFYNNTNSLDYIDFQSSFGDINQDKGLGSKFEKYVEQIYAVQKNKQNVSDYMTNCVYQLNNGKKAGELPPPSTAIVVKEPPKIQKEISKLYKSITDNLWQR